MNKLIPTKFFFSAALLVCALMATVTSIPAQKKKAAKMDTPGIAAIGMTAASIDIKITGGSNTGAPAGFSLQWMTKEDYVANGNQWFASEDNRLCKASFSGNANLSRYNLEPNEMVIVRVGDFLFDNGASTNCGEPLECDTVYVFRAFAHASSSFFRSDFTGNVEKATLPCGDDQNNCTYSQGYWKTHGPIPTGNNSNEWPSAGSYGSIVLFELGNPAYSYTDLEWLSIFNTPAQGNGLVALAHQLMAAKLNVANGADPAALGSAIQDADNLIGSRILPPVGSGFVAPSVTGSLTETLADYNEGATGPGHCQ